VQTDAPFPQLIPPPVTVPVPETETVSRNPAPLVPPLNVAVTLLDWFIDTVHVVEVPPHGPVQPTNVAPVTGVATRVTTEFCVKLPLQMVAPAPQLIAPDPPLTLPFPTTLTSSVTAVAKDAVTPTALSIVKVHVSLGTDPVGAAHGALQPVKVDPSFGLACSVIVAPAGSFFVQVAGPGQVIPPPVTVPWPDTVTVRSCCAPDSLHVAATFRSSSRITVQATFDPLQAPPQPLKTYPGVGVCRTVSTDPFGTVQLQKPTAFVPGPGMPLSEPQ
jgi:hypothetical protein